MLLLNLIGRHIGTCLGAVERTYSGVNGYGAIHGMTIEWVRPVEALLLVAAGGESECGEEACKELS